jgi:hypothetical protein
MRRRSRYPNVKRTMVDGHRFASRHEADRYLELKLLESAGLVRHIKLQPRFPIKLGTAEVLIRSDGYPNGRRLTYVADFRYFDVDLDRFIIEDVKMQSRHRTEVYKIKRALVEAMGITIVEV